MAIITLTSDFGLRDYIAGAVKGQLLQISPDFQLIDISHEVAPFNYPQAAYICRNAILQFPAKTYHVILVNLFEQKPEHLLLARHNGQYIFCADNGLINMIIPPRPEKVVGIPLDPSANKNTLYCSRVIGRAIQELERGARPESLGNTDIRYIEKNELRPTLNENYMEGQIIFIDNFENVIVNITREEFEEQRRGRGFRIVFKRNESIERVSDTYADVPLGEKLALFNSVGYLEIAIHKGNAAGLFGLQDYTDQSLQHYLFYQTVRIYFE
ncbi:MAG TPA: SAM-dependent chlorinase/fluorinase [Puia sp.]|nr:SAM-dependent chlorinase/fluorinase [Puia sp.]